MKWEGNVLSADSPLMSDGAILLVRASVRSGVTALQFDNEDRPPGDSVRDSSAQRLLADAEKKCATPCQPWSFAGHHEWSGCPLVRVGHKDVDANYWWTVLDCCGEVEAFEENDSPHAPLLLKRGGVVVGMMMPMRQAL